MSDSLLNLLPYLQVSLGGGKEWRVDNCGAACHLRLGEYQACFEFTRDCVDRLGVLASDCALAQMASNVHCLLIEKLATRSVHTMHLTVHVDCDVLPNEPYG